MKQHKVSYEIMAWGPRYRAQILVDSYPTEKAYFDSYKDAEKWAKQRVSELTREGMRS